MRLRPAAIALFLALAASLRAADNPATEPAFQQPAAFQALLKLGAATQAIYAIFPNETYLSFAQEWKGTDADLSHFYELTTTSTVTIYGDKNAALIIPHLAAMPTLQRVSLDDVTLSPAQIKLLAVLKLKYLTIGTPATTLTLDGLVNVEMLFLHGAVEHVTLTNVPSLQLVYMEAPSKTPAKFSVDVPSAPKFKTLVLKNLTLSDFPLPPMLEYVDFSNSVVPDSLLQKIPELKNLTTLNLTGVQNAGIALSRLTDSHLTSLSAANAHITDNDIAAIKDLSHIQSLNLSLNPDFTGKAMSPVGVTDEMLQIQFNQTAVNDVTIAALAAATKTTALFINLDDSDITDKAVASLAAFPNLVDLSLAKTHITDVSLMSLANAKRLSSIHLTGAPVSPSGIDDLRKALPKANINSGFQQTAAPEK